MAGDPDEQRPTRPGGQVGGYDDYGRPWGSTLIEEAADEWLRSSGILDEEPRR